MRIIFYILVSVTIVGCISAKGKISGSGINVQDSTHLINVQANSFNGEGEINAYQ